MKKVFDILLNIYLSPLKLSARIALYAKGRLLQFDEHYLIALDVIRRKFPDDDGVVVDIGAYDADSTSYFARSLPNNRILGFEPNPGPYQKGLKNIRGQRNVELYNIGFSDKKADVDFYVTKDSVSSSILSVKDNAEFSFDRVIQATMTTLDDFFASYDNILLLKLDVQGGELKVLEGGEQTLRKTRLVLTEVLNSDFYDGGCLYYEVDSLLRRNEFRIYSIISNYNNEGVKYFDVLYHRVPGVNNTEKQ